MSPLFSSETRLYALRWRESGPALLVEAWWGQETLNGGFEFQIDCLSNDAFIDPETLLGKAPSLLVSLPDGSRSHRSGLLRAARRLDADGGFGRYRITMVPWTWLLSQVSHCRVFQEKTAAEIVDQVFSGYSAHAVWSWSDDASAFLAEIRPRNYCVQYRESDYAFISRLLAEEGLGWCVEEDEAAPAGHRMRIFADSSQLPEDLLSAHAAGGPGIRFHRADSQEEQDAIVAFGLRQRVSITRSSALSYDYGRKRSVAASVPVGRSGDAPALERYDFSGACAWANEAEAERYQRIAAESSEAHRQRFVGRGTVRSFRPGTRFTLFESPLKPSGLFDQDGEGDSFSLVDICHAGINNLSGERIEAIATRLRATGASAESSGIASTEESRPTDAPLRLSEVLVRLAAEHGYGNEFQCIRASARWRALLVDDTGQRFNPRPTAPGPMSAIVVGPDGETTPCGPDELWCDALGRVKVRFHWQRGDESDDRLSCWLRLASRQAGAGMGWQWLPRIGQEVLVGFVESDIDRPVILGALYNGQGEGGVVPTPGGEHARESDPSVFDRATDGVSAAQGNLAGGNGPAWHGAAGESHRHAGALNGFKSKEFGGAGYSQLVFDDTDAQLRVQLKSTEAGSELNLGHLIHQADNYRGSFRGAGAELRTDAWGALRGAQGVILSSWQAGSDAAPAGDLATAVALLRQAEGLARVLSSQAGTHRTVQLAAVEGSRASGQSRIDAAAAPLKALLTAASGTVDADRFEHARSDAAAKSTAAAQDTVPHTTDPLIVQAARAGIGMVAGQHLQWSCGEVITLASGEDASFAIGGKARIHAGQAIGLLAGALEGGKDEGGVSMIAARDDIDLQAQSDALKLQSKKDLKLVSATADVTFAAARRVVLAVSGGASITIDGGIAVACPGTITVHASKKSFSGPQSSPHVLPSFPRGDFKQKKRFAFSS